MAKQTGLSENLEMVHGALRSVILVRDKTRAVGKATGNYGPGYLQPGKSGDGRRAWRLSSKICCSGFNSKLCIITIKLLERC